MEKEMERKEILQEIEEVTNNSLQESNERMKESDERVEESIAAIATLQQMMTLELQTQHAKESFMNLKSTNQGKSPEGADPKINESWSYTMATKGSGNSSIHKNISFSFKNIVNVVE